MGEDRDNKNNVEMERMKARKRQEEEEGMSEKRKLDIRDEEREINRTELNNDRVRRSVEGKYDKGRKEVIRNIEGCRIMKKMDA